MRQEAPLHVFGPVLSGRLGRSLGLDLLGSRVCSMNCVYCESGPLARLTLTRAPYVPAQTLREELLAWEAARLDRGEPLPDAVTLGGLGEPTLNSDMPQIMADARAILPGVPVAVLTNATLMTNPQVRAELRQADIVLPSLDSLVPEEFTRVNRGHPSLNPKDIAEGVLAFRTGWEGRLYLEVLLVEGVNDSSRNLEELAEYCNRLQPDRVDVTTLSRPGTEPWAKPVQKDVLAHWRQRLGTRAVQSARPGTGVAGTTEKRQEHPGGMSLDEAQARILASLARRPQTVAQLSAALIASASVVERALAALVAQGQAEPVRGNAARAVAAGQAAEVFFKARG